ncbi:hypothetical protein GDO81_013433 [Engystomops pustulosus]|uniref:Uncharacterized protein n=1 Tax=Engystomops pustulosus TaxID=76066 RepID=A0AAV7B405_ENGPU|nr:hypothetical protein GDO81_013433 [Engystomops pustulosus]
MLLGMSSTKKPALTFQKWKGLVRTRMGSCLMQLRQGLGMYPLKCQGFHLSLQLPLHSHPFDNTTTLCAYRTKTANELFGAGSCESLAIATTNMYLQPGPIMYTTSTLLPRGSPSFCFMWLPLASVEDS